MAAHNTTDPISVHLPPTYAARNAIRRHLVELWCCDHCSAPFSVAETDKEIAVTFHEPADAALFVLFRGLSD